MRGQAWIHLITSVYIACMRPGCIAVAGDGSLSCVISYKAWDLPTTLKVNWSVPDMPADHDELDINITRYMSGNRESCPEVSLTSCSWNYGQESMSFDYDFVLSVTITEKKSRKTLYKKEWDVNPDNCKKPPTVDHVTTDVVNSTCVDVRWWYDREAYCWDSTYYKISFRPEHATELTINTTLNEGCNTSRIFCGLSPYTRYVITVQAKFSSFLDQMTGHFSDSTATNITTPEDVHERTVKRQNRMGSSRRTPRRSELSVPAGAPEMVNGGFSLVKNDCAATNVRAIRLFWKDVPAEMKHGVITHFFMEIIPTSTSDEHSITKSVDGRRYNDIVSLQCDTGYTIKLRAATSVGTSSVHSSSSIPRFSQDSGDVLEVIPVISNGSFYVYWIVDTPVTKHLSNGSRVLWCLTGVESYCLSPINWTTVSNNSAYAIVPVQPETAPYKYRLGVSYGDRGIQWANCHYTKLTDPRPPSGLRMQSDKTLPEGSMTVYWDNDPCESGPLGPYIHKFLLSFCKVKDRNENSCIDTLLKEVVDNRRSSYVLINLDAGALYRVCVQTEGKASSYSDPSCIYGQPAVHPTFWNPRAIVICVIIATLLFSCAIYGGIKCKIHFHRKLRTFIQNRFRIQLPGNYRELENDNNISSVNEYLTTL